MKLGWNDSFWLYMTLSYHMMLAEIPYLCNVYKDDLIQIVFDLNNTIFLQLFSK